MLERLTEEWTQVTDANFYKDLMFEKQLWMLTALDFLARDGKLRVQREVEDMEEERALSLFESKGICIFSFSSCLNTLLFLSTS